MAEIDREASWRRGELVLMQRTTAEYHDDNIFTHLITKLHDGLQDLTNSKPLQRGTPACTMPASSCQHQVSQENMQRASERRPYGNLVSQQKVEPQGSSMGDSPKTTARSAALDTYADDLKSRVRCEQCSLLMQVPCTARKVRCCRCGHIFPGAFRIRGPFAPSQKGGSASRLRGAEPDTPPPGAPTYRVVGPTSECIHVSLAAQGFVRDDSAADWVLAWGSTMAGGQISQMKSFQRHNHIPGWSLLNNKGVLGRMAEKARAAGKSLSTNVPKTFVLPEHAEQLERDHAEGGGPYIVKPIGGTRGRGIRLLEKAEGEDVKKLGRVVVQRYVKEPHLIQGRKYDLRLYVTATSADPMRVYLHEEGYARFCSESFDLSRPHELFRHVTNSNLQKFHAGYDLNNQSTAQRPRGNKWHISAVREEWRRCGSDKLIWERIREAIVRAFVLFESVGCEESRRVVRHPRNCFCLFGVDILLDSRLRPWLLELNGVPSTGTESALDIAVKAAMVGDLLSLVGLASVDPAAAQRRAVADLAASLSQRQGSRVAPPPLQPRGQAGRPVPSAEAVRAVLARSLPSVQPGDVELVLEWEEEKARGRGWVPIYPSPSMGRFLPVLSHRRSNQVMLAWTTAL